jgi:hypothetical protein
MSDLIVNNPSAVGISLHHNSNIIAVGDDNKTRAICFMCLAPFSVFFSRPVHSASTEAVASRTEVQETVASVVEVQETVTSVVKVQDVNDNGGMVQAWVGHFVTPITLP